ncbi:MAG: DNA-3-methyladenine glycosylase I [Candidatus Rokubacteria bacterium]|nr:DNA-3-methyladenine glycosylase I [Candidatus Rokubacteria bacterium]
MSAREKVRCDWARKEPALGYHDREWGVPLRDDRALFELLILEGAQAGLSWDTILNKREHYRRAFDRFDHRRIARYDGARVRALLRDPGIVRNRLKIAAAIENARALLALEKEWGGLAAYLWAFAGGRPRRNAWRSVREVPARTPQSDALSQDLRRRGFRFVGSTICYAFMQATGMVNDHVVGCFRYREIPRALPPPPRGSGGRRPPAVRGL